MGGKVFPRLKELWCNGNYHIGEVGWLSIMKGLEEGGCPEMQLLNFSECEWTTTVAEAFTHVLSSGHCHGLQELYLYSSFEDDESIRLVLQSLKNVSFPSMRKFDLDDFQSNQDYSIMLGEVLAAGNSNCLGIQGAT